MRKRGDNDASSHRRRSRKSPPPGAITARQVLLSPVTLVRGVAGGARLVGRGLLAPFCFVGRVRSGRKAKKLTKAERLAQVRFDRMAPRMQEEVKRTRRRLLG